MYLLLHIVGSIYSYRRSGYFQDTLFSLISYYEAIHVFFLIFTGREGFQLFEFVHNNNLSFLFPLPFTYRENREFKVTVKLTGSKV